jgi:hypothetical protein
MKYTGIDKDPPTIFAPRTCECFCGIGGKCQHRWGAESTYDEGFKSVSCERCGISAASHDQKLEMKNVVSAIPARNEASNESSKSFDIQ